MSLTPGHGPGVPPPSQKLDPPRLSAHLSRPMKALLLLVALAQQPTPAQVQQALQQPGSADLVRSRIQASGLTAEQIRSRLATSGYSAALLDAYLGSGASGQVPATP